MKKTKALTSKQLLMQVSRPVRLLIQRMEKLARKDPALADIVSQLKPVQAAVWAMQDTRELAEAQALDAGEVCWQVFRPSGGFSIFDQVQVVTRTPRTVHVLHEYFSLPDAPPRLAPHQDPWAHLDKELHKEPLDLVKFRAHAAKVDAAYKRWLSQGGPEKQEVAA